MCYSGCPYENWEGACTGIGPLKKGRPHCFDVTDEEWEKQAAEDRYDVEEAALNEMLESAV